MIFSLRYTPDSEIRLQEENWRLDASLIIDGAQRMQYSINIDFMK